MRALQELSRRTLAPVRVVAADIDGTVTTAGRISPETVATFQALQHCGCHVVLVTGRSAGWGAALARYVPGLAGIVAENGAVLLPAAEEETEPVLLDDSLVDGTAPGLAVVEACLAAVLARYPRALTGVDNFCRLSDRTLEVSAEIDPLVVGAMAGDFGLSHTYSSVHHHLSRSSWTKRTGLLAALHHLVLPGVDPAREVVTIGDSGNDAALFSTGTFAATVGVKGVVHHLAALGGATPSFVTSADGGQGFNELAAMVIESRPTR